MEKKLELRLKRFCEEARKALGERLRAVVVYGSAASGEYAPRTSDVNMLVIVEKVDFEALKLSYKLFQKYKRVTRRVPLLFDKDYIERSADVFPIEFLDMKDNYFVLCGDDPLKDLRIDSRNLRFQCEQELKGKLIKLRQSYLDVLWTRDLKNILISSFPSFLTIFRALMRLKGLTPPSKHEELIKEVSRLYDLNEDIPQTLLKIKKGIERVSHKGVGYLCRDWLAELEKVTKSVDELRG